MSKLAIITVNYNNYTVTEEYLNSFKKQTNSSFKVFVTDLSSEKSKIVSPTFTDVLISKNRGYAYGLNAGLKKALDSEFEKFVCMNNDTEVPNNFVESVLKSLSNRQKSLIGGKIYYSKGFEFHKDRYSTSDLGNVIWYAGGLIDWNNAFTNHIGVDQVDNGQCDIFQETEFVTGCLMCFDKELLTTVGYFDESYFLYYEDADWCERIKRAGLKLYYDPSIMIWHKNSQSTDGSGSKLHMHYQEKNRLKFGFTYAPLRTKFHLLKNYLASRFK